MEKMWCMLVHFGTNLWFEEGNNKGGGGKVWRSPASDTLRFDRDVFYRYLDELRASGVNTIVLDVAEALRYESHPELAVKGSYTHAEMREMLDYMYSLGFSVIPKLNFSTCHDIWLGEYSRMVSTPKYYEVCRDLITEVCHLFNAKYMHLGMDEENYPNQRDYDCVIVRQNDLWWHDLYFLVDCVEACGARAMMWSDYARHRPEEFLAKIPRSVVQCNWYYFSRYAEDYTTLDEEAMIRVRPFHLLAEAGIDQLPTASTEYDESALTCMAEYLATHIDNSHILGFMQTTWADTTARSADFLTASAKATGRAREAYETAIKG